MRDMTLREFARDNELFRKACELASIEPTKRQASKWIRGKGLARTFRPAAGRELAPHGSLVATDA